MNKDELELEKLNLEILELKKVWWKKPSYIAALFPTVLAFATLIYGFANGYFQASFVKLENQKHNLQEEIKEFSKQKVNLENQKIDLEKRIVELSAQLEESDKTIKTAEKIKEIAQSESNYRAYRHFKCEEELETLKSKNKRFLSAPHY